MARSERSLIARHAATVLVGQLATMAFGVTDAIVAGRFAEGALAALSVGSAIFISVFVSLSGVLQALLPVWAELHGGGRSHRIGPSVRQSLYLAALVVVLGMSVLLFPAPLLRWAEVPSEMRKEVQTYLQILAFALAPALLFRVFSTLNQSLGRPRMITAMQIGSLGVKLPLSVWFTFGGAGLPAMGLVGCAIATLIVYWALLVCAIWLMRTRPFFRELRLWKRIEPPDWPQIRRFARLGLPAGMAVLVEVTSFTLMALFIARLGTAASASHQIASSLTAVAYMMPLSLSIATSARVSFWLGASDEGRARGAVAKGLEMTLLAALLGAISMVVLRSQLATIYSPNPSVVALASTLLLATAAYHLADAVQTLCVFLLRCYRITVMPLVIYAVLLWGLGLGGSYLLAYRGLGPWPAMQSPVAFWIMSAAALWVTALLFVALLWRTLRQRRRA